VEGDRERQSVGSRPVEQAERVIDPAERRAPEDRADPESIEQPTHPFEHAAGLDEHEQGERDCLQGEEPQHAVEEERPLEDRAPRHHDADQ
jgi:hypothetical protein